MADYGGRKWTIFVGCTIVVIAGIVQCFSVNIHMFTAARFLSTLEALPHCHRYTDTGTVGMGSGFSGLGSPLLITELAHPAERGKITALYKYVALITLTWNSCANTAEALNTTLVLSSEAVSDVTSFGSCSGLTMVHRDHVWYARHSLQLVLEIA